MCRLFLTHLSLPLSVRTYGCGTILDLCAALIRNALLNYLCRKGRQSLGYDPIDIVGNESNDNLLATAIPFGGPS